MIFFFYVALIDDIRIALNQTLNIKTAAINTLISEISDYALSSPAALGFLTQALSIKASIGQLQGIIFTDDINTVISKLQLFLASINSAIDEWNILLPQIVINIATTTQTPATTPSRKIKM